MLPDSRWIGVVQLGVRLHLPEFRDTPLGDKRVDICGRERKLEFHDLLPVFGPDILDDQGLQIFDEMKPELPIFLDNE